MTSSADSKDVQEVKAQVFVDMIVQISSLLVVASILGFLLSVYCLLTMHDGEYLKVFAGSVVLLAAAIGAISFLMSGLSGPKPRQPLKN